MGYSARYHAASLAAVFVALAVGILIGVGFGSDLVNGTADDLEASLRSDLDRFRAEVDAQQAALDADRDFEQAIFPALVARELRRQRIGVLALGGLDQGTASAIESGLAPAGATVAEVAVVREAPDLAALGATLRGRTGRLLARGDEDELRRFGERSGRALVRGGPGFDSLRGTLLSRYSGKPEGIDGVVVVRQQPDGLDPDQQSATNALEESLISGLATVPAVAVEPSDADPSSIGFYDSQGLASVDNVNQISGRAALVFTLARGASGNFGIKDTADSLLPDLLAPDGVGGGGGGNGGGPASAGNRG